RRSPRAECRPRVRRCYCCRRVRWRVRKLSPDEAALWAKVTATIRPLSREPIKVEPPAAIPLTATGKPRGRVPPVRPAAPQPPARATIQGATLDGSWDRRLKSGTIIPDRTLDLHRHNLDRVWEAIDHALERSIAAEDRLLLLITGHARTGDPPLERGRIRAAVH